MKTFKYFLLIAIIFASISGASLDLNDWIQFFDYDANEDVTGKVCEIARDSGTNKKIFLVRLDSNNKIIEAPRGQYLILESAFWKKINDDYESDQREQPALSYIFDPKKYFYGRKANVSMIDSVREKLAAESSFWIQFESITFLSEGSDEVWEGCQWHIPLASAIHQMYPQIKITKTDLDKMEAFSYDGKVCEFAINNTHAFAERIMRYGAKSDALIMLRGLCHCGAINNNTSFTCGGINTANQKEMTKFVRQVAESVDWQKSHAFAYIEGAHYHDHFEFCEDKETIKETHNRFSSRQKSLKRATTRWRHALEKVAADFDVNVEIDFSPEGHFRGLLFTSKNAQ